MSAAAVRRRAGLGDDQCLKRLFPAGNRVMPCQRFAASVSNYAKRRKQFQRSAGMGGVVVAVAFLVLSPVILASVISTAVAIVQKWSARKVIGVMAGHVVTAWLIVELFLPGSGDPARPIHLWSSAWATVFIIAPFVLPMIFIAVRRLKKHLRQYANSRQTGVVAAEGRMRKLLKENRLSLFVAALAVVWLYWRLPDASEQRLERVPGSVDPILQMAPLEKERIRPDRGNRPEVPPVPGKQTLVLHPYMKKKDGAPDPLIVLRIPDEYFAGGQRQKPWDVYGLNLLIDYPSMKRGEFAEQGCNKNLIILNITYYAKGRKPVAEFARQGLDMWKEVTSKGSKYKLEQVDNSFGYDELFLETDLTEDRVNKRYYIKRDAAGVSQEYIEIWENVACPSVIYKSACSFQPSLELDYDLGIDHWQDQVEVKNKICNLVASFYDRELALRS